jgi:thiopeptide-type bacteriocin biosynthesis protein
LLISKIAAFIETNRDQIGKWFFIRFDDGRPHLRLRLQIRQNVHVNCLAENLQKILDSQIKNGQVADIQIKSYFREIARYGKEYIGQVEEFFCHDSQYVLKLLKKKHENDTLYRSALTSLCRFIALSFPDFGQQIHFVNFMAMAYSKEFAMNPDDYKKMNQDVKAFKVSILPITRLPGATGRLKKHEYQFKKLINLSAPDTDRYRLTADILHMHINRLFSSDQRAHEAILYQYLLQLLKTWDFQQRQAADEA